MKIIKMQILCDVKYGLLYNWYAVTDARNIANTGWHVPTYDEVETFVNYVGHNSSAELKEVGTTYWDTANGTNIHKFNARGAGVRNNTDGFGYLKIGQEYFLQTSYNATIAFVLGVGDVLVSIFHDVLTLKIYGLSCRLIKDSTLLSDGQEGTYTGNDGKVYQTICIGTQEWLAYNLCETKYRNGDTIPEVTDNTEWGLLTTGALCAYDNDWSYVYEGYSEGMVLKMEEISSFTVNYGLLYNWYAITSTKKITSTDDWIVPALTDYQLLRSYLDPGGTDSINIAGGKLKESGFIYWLSPNGGSNSALFNARGAGYRASHLNSLFIIINEIIYLWTTSLYSSTTGYSPTIMYTHDDFYCTTRSNKKSGISVRLLKTSTTLLDGEEGTYTGNDGKIYRTICIGTQEWLADNLCETKFRDNSSIPEVTDATAWTALTTEALCAYNNNWDNAYNTPLDKKMLNLFDMDAFGLASTTGGYVYRSYDFFQTWEPITELGIGTWGGVAMSRDRRIQVIAIDSGGILRSTNYGQNWETTSAPVRRWFDVDMSADGKYIVANAYQYYLYLSSDYGETWVPKSTLSSRNWAGNSISADGKYIMAFYTNGVIYRSEDYGANWETVAYPDSINFDDISISDTGQYQIFCVGLGYLYISSDYGVTFTAVISAGSRFWNDVSISGDGKYMSAVCWPSGLDPGNIYTSSDYGVSFHKIGAAGDGSWRSNSVSHSGKYHIAGLWGGKISYSDDYGETYHESTVDMEYWIQMNIND